MKCKKCISIVISLLLIFSLSSYAYGAENTLEKISSGYGIPIHVLKTLDPEMIQSLYNDVTSNKLISSTDTYVKVTTSDAGDIVMEKASFKQFLNETKGKTASNTDASSGWMKFHLTVYEINSTTGQATCAFTWLTSPSPRMKDAVGVSLRNGTVIHNTANGFYNHTAPKVNYTYDFKASDIEETGAGATAKFRLRLCNYISGITDYAFLRVNFTKEGNSEGVNGTYAHQKISISLNPSFSINRSGRISISGSTGITNNYTQETGYVSIVW